MNESTAVSNSATGNLSARFWPVVVSGAPAENLYYCMPEIETAEGDYKSGDEVLLAGSTERILDQARLTSTISEVLIHVGKFLTKHSASGKSITAIVPLNVVGLGLDSFANAFAENCRSIQRQSGGQLVFELFNFPEKFNLEYLDNLSITVFPFCRHYVARPSPGWTDFTIFSNCNFQGVAFDLMDKDWPADRIKPHLKTFCAAAAAGRLDAYAHGIGSEIILDAARRAGFKYLVGSGVQGAIT